MNRGEFLTATTLGGGTVLVGLRPASVTAEPPSETGRIRLSQSIAICTAPQLVAGELLKSEGFTDIQYQDIRKATTGALPEVAAGTADIGITFSGPTIIQIDRGDPIVVLSGIHPGCFELFGTERVRSLKDLKGKKIAVVGLSSSPHVFGRHPVATRRALRALLKATTLCAGDPGEAARLMVERGYGEDLDLVTHTMKEMPYARWRELDPENTVRFYALRLREAGMIKSNPAQILARGTDWRFLHALKKELKA